MPKWAAARTIVVASNASETIRTAHSRPPVSAGGSGIFRKYRLTYGKDLCYSSEAMEEVFFLCLKLYGGENYASEDYIGLHRMQAA